MRTLVRKGTKILLHFIISNPLLCFICIFSDCHIVNCFVVFPIIVTVEPVISL
jgi:hypothetical protein